MDANPTVSILLPVRDAAETLPACVRSIETQSCTDWECIAVDDHSSDASREILEDWAARDERVRVIDAPDPGGIVVALEEARREARAALLARHDADDRSHPARLSRQVEVMWQETDLAALGCLTRTPAPQSDGMRRYRRWLATCISAETCAQEIWIESPIAHPTAVMRADAVDQVGGYREMGWPEDYDLWLRLHRAGWPVRSLAETLYEWTDRPNRLSRLDPRYSAAAFLRCRVHHLRRWLAERAVSRPLVVWGAGRDGRRFARAWEEESRTPGSPAGEIVAFVDIDPRKIGRTRRGRPVLDLTAARGAFPDALYLAAVGVIGARKLIRSALTGEGLLEGRDFVCMH